jgi:hypothetical protein
VSSELSNIEILTPGYYTIIGDADGLLLEISINGTIGGKGGNNTSTGQIGYTSGSAVFSRLILNVTAGDTIGIKIGNNGLDAPDCNCNAQRGASGETSFVSLNGITLVELIGSEGGQGGGSYCGGTPSGGSFVSCIGQNGKIIFNNGARSQKFFASENNVWNIPIHSALIRRIN